MFRMLCWLLIGVSPAYVPPQTMTGKLTTNIATAGGDCAHRWWLQLDSPGNKTRRLVALEPEGQVPPGLNNSQVRVEGESKVCHGVEGGSFPVLVIKSIKPADQ